MEYVYAALLLHKLKQNITEDNIANIIKATGITPDDLKVKALVAALSEVNIEEALKAAPLASAATVGTVPSASISTVGCQSAAPQEEEKKEEKKEEEALEGLSSLFG